MATADPYDIELETSTATGYWLICWPEGQRTYYRSKGDANQLAQRIYTAIGEAIDPIHVGRIGEP